MAKAKKLERFTKEEIIEALCNQFDWAEKSKFDNTIERLILDIKRQKIQSLSKKQEQLDAETTEAMSAYFNWQLDMVEKYGENGECKYVDISPSDLHQGFELSAKWQALEEQLEFIRKEIGRI